MRGERREESEGMKMEGMKMKNGSDLEMKMSGWKCQVLSVRLKKAVVTLLS